ncbi:signal peptide peptidase SppA [Gracilimonas amylolytica]|uniref:signal peptide peptidase SppA n=1 Tax=Gracilimonas amylolytica TaxID=1749045 RepID=UPI000CD8D40D|nr:signal peptide peptidase SppA [Gracilimonas amylolytica]
MTFFKSFLASCLGIFVSVILLMLVFFIFLVSSSSQPLPDVKDNSVLTIEMTGNLPARVLPSPFETYFDPAAGNKLSLVTLKENLAKAAADDRIKGVWIKANLMSAPWANLEQAYDHLKEYKESGKFLYFSTDDIGMNEQSYYLATVADSVFSPPYTNFEFDGFISQFTFYTDMLDKIGVEPEIFRVGKYKSAVEPFLETSASPESRQQISEILNAATSTFTEAVAAKTGRSVEEITELMNSAPVNRLETAHEFGLIDDLLFENEVEHLIKERVGLTKDYDLNRISFKKYGQIPAASAGVESPSTFDRIAVIYADGAIMPDLGTDNPLGSSGTITAENIQKQVNEALNSSSVKALVVHINSPGGSATTSDLIWNTLKTASEKKPVVASMGGVAASGGYYMAMGADTVVANANTITGSIGIFNLLFNVKELTEDKIGLDFEILKTHQYADLLDLTTPFTPAEGRVIQQNVENGYEVFLNRVAEARGMTRDEVHELAQGRVWTGSAAQEVGLVDEIGSIDDAIAIAAEMAGMEEYRIENYPKQKGLFEVLMSGTEAKVYSYLNSWFPFTSHEEVRNLRMLMNQPAGQNWMILPTEISIR